MKSGKFITLEGGEGAGKSTQATFLKSFLEHKGFEVILTREPGGSPGAEKIRDLLIHHPWDSLSEYLLLSAARRDHIEQTIRPALSQGKWVICDRFFESSLAYQGAGGGVKEEVLYQIYRIIALEFEPHVTFIFDMSVEKALQRTRSRAAHDDWFESKSEDFHERVRLKFQKIAQQNPERYFLIDGSGSREEVSGTLEIYMKHILEGLECLS